jgi:predicted SAM-dependent methyltransferase
MTAYKIKELEVYPNHGVIRQNTLWIIKQIYKIFPRHLILQIWSELHLIWIRMNSFRCIRLYKNKKNLKVNIGAGPNGQEGWVNIDAYKQKGVNLVYDCRKSLPFQNNSVKYIFVEHFFEHLDYTEEVPHFLSECLRVLNPGGIIRIIVPDMELYIKGYLDSGWDTYINVRQLSNDLKDHGMKTPYHCKMELFNVVMRQGTEHKYGYDFENLKFVLDYFGFRDVKKQQFKVSYLDELCIDHPSHKKESLYIEAIK